METNPESQTDTEWTPHFQMKLSFLPTLFLMSCLFALAVHYAIEERRHIQLERDNAALLVGIDAAKATYSKNLTTLSNALVISKQESADLRDRLLLLRARSGIAPPEYDWTNRWYWTWTNWSAESWTIPNVSSRPADPKDPHVKPLMDLMREFDRIKVDTSVKSVQSPP